MPTTPLGVSLKSLNMPLRRSLPEARRLAARGVEIDAAGDLAPQTLTQTGRREIRHLLRSHDLEASAVVCPLRRGLDVAENQEARLDFVRQVMTLAFDLGPRLVIVQAGRVPEKDDDPHLPLLREALTTLGQHGDRTGVQLALDTGLESGEAMTAFLDRFDVGSLGVNFNPANLVISGHDPYAAVRALSRRILAVRAQDARRISPNRMDTVPLGHGDLDWLGLLGALEEVGYRRYLTVAADNAAETAAGVAFLRRVAGL